jgi:hypothetical protein
MLADNCSRLEEMNNSANVKIEMTGEQIFKEIEALPKSERERLVQRMRESADIPQDFIGFGRFQPAAVRVDGNRAE